MATHSSVLAWRIPGTGEPGGLPSTGSPLLVNRQELLELIIVFQLWAPEKREEERTGKVGQGGLNLANSLEGNHVL